MAEQKPGCLLVLFKLFSAKATGPERLPYRLADQFLSNAEVSFYHVLRKAAGGDLAICPKVRLADVLSVTASGGERQSAFNRISGKHVDFLLCDALTMKPALAIELDDSSHTAAKRASRDEFVDKAYQAAGLPVLHMSVRRTYSPQEMATAVRDAVAGGLQQPAAQPQEESGVEGQAGFAQAIDSAPMCPKCGVQMVLRSSSKGKHKGRSFYGCPNFPQCRETLPAPAGDVERGGGPEANS